jgi:hypothetical protein
MASDCDMMTKKQEAEFHKGKYQEGGKKYKHI